MSKVFKQYPEKMKKLEKDREELLAFTTFRQRREASIKTRNTIESAFATIRIRSRGDKNYSSRKTTISIVFKLLSHLLKKAGTA
ncbi:MAG: transposase [Arsenophonus sp. NEOnobi-MAG3]